MLDPKEFLKTEELHPERDQARVAHYQHKLDFETDSWDLDQATKRGEKVVIIDARSKAAYENEHIPGAVNFPWRTINRESAKDLLNPDVLCVTYCDGIGCNASTKSALKLTQLGYKVKELMGGIDWWKRDKYPTVGKAISQAKKETKEQQNSVAVDCGCDEPNPNVFFSTPPAPQTKSNKNESKKEVGISTLLLSRL